MIYRFGFVLTLCLLASGFLAVTGSSRKQALSTPTLEQGQGSSPGWIDVTVCAGESGAPAGFSLQWMTCEEFAQHSEPGADGLLGTEDDIVVFGQWYDSSDSRLCKASFSGNAQGHSYDLLPGECKTVRVGDLLLDNGASTNCIDVLDCGTCYVFRVFAHATRTHYRSSWTEDLFASTADCGPCYGALSQGGFANNFSCYLESISLGSRYYTAEQLVAILRARGEANNMLTKLAKQLIAVKTSLLLFGPVGRLPIGDDCEDELLLACIAEADLVIGDRAILVDDIDTATAGRLIECLDDWISAHHLPDGIDLPPCP